MNEHPYGYPIAILLLSVALFFLAKAWKTVDSHLETRRERRLDRNAAHEEIRQRLRAAADRINNSGLE